MADWWTLIKKSLSYQYRSIWKIPFSWHFKGEFLFWVKIWSETDQSENSIMKLAYAKNNIITDKKAKKFLWEFFKSFAEVYSSGGVDWAIICHIR